MPPILLAMIPGSITATVFVPIDPRTKRDKLAYTLCNSGCRGLVVADYALDEVATVRKDMPSIEWVWALDAGEEGAPPTRSRLSTPRARSAIRGAW